MCDEFERDVSTNGMSGHLGSLLEELLGFERESKEVSLFLKREARY